MTQLIDFSLPFPTAFPTRDEAEQASAQVQHGLLVDEDGVILADIKEGNVIPA